VTFEELWAKYVRAEIGKFPVEEGLARFFWKCGREFGLHESEQTGKQLVGVHYEPQEFHEGQP
jgi:hypothetical protein